jgi:hypothetical protein
VARSFDLRSEVRHSIKGIVLGLQADSLRFAAAFQGSCGFGWKQTTEIALALERCNHGDVVSSAAAIARIPHYTDMRVAGAFSAV